MYQRGGTQMREIIDNTRLTHLPSIMFPHIDRPLISAFVERWQPDTNSFHMPFGEMSINLFDVNMILRIGVPGKLVSASPTVDRAKALVKDFFECEKLELPKYYKGGGAYTKNLVSFIRSTDGFDDHRAKAWIWYALGSTLFVDKSGNQVKPGFLEDMRAGSQGPGEVNRYSWASATLANLYRQLGIATRGGILGIGGCLTLLQAWIYEYFPCLRPTGAIRIRPETEARATRWEIGMPRQTEERLVDLRNLLDRLSAADVSWTPYGDVPNSLSLRVSYVGWLDTL